MGVVMEGYDMRNTYHIVDDVAYITDSKGNRFMVDAEDIDRIKVCTWFKDESRGYIKGTIKRKHIYLHRFILGLPDGIVDHINRDKTDNRKCNLRVCTISESNMNRGVQKSNKTGYKGVAHCKSRKKSANYRAQINVNGERIRLGWFRTADEAKIAYDEAARKFFGEYAPV